MTNQGGPGKRRLSRSATILAVATSLVCAGWALAAFGDGWLGRALRSPPALRAGAVCLACIVALYLIAGLLWRLGRARRRLDGSAGTAAIEFVLVFPIALMIVLIMIQSMLVVVGNIVVHYSAFSAARAAVVYVPEELSYEEPRNVVADPAYSGKFHHIRCAAVEAVKGVSAGKQGAGGAGGSGGSIVLEDGIDRFFSLYGRPSPRWVRTMLASKYEYAWDYTEVTLQPPGNGQQYGDHEDLTVSVRHMLYLSMPYARAFFGRPLPGGTGDYATQANATYTLTNQGMEDEIDVEVFPRYVGQGQG